MGTIIDKKQRIIDLYKSGWSLTSIANECGVQTTAVSAFLNRAGLRAVIRTDRRNLSPGRQRELSRRYGAGELSGPLAKEFGINQCTVRAIAKRHGVQAKPVGSAERIFSKKDVATMDRLWRSGTSQQKIADRLGTTALIVCRTLRRYGVSVESGRATGSRHGMWKGGRHMQAGYWVVHVDADHKFAGMAHADGYVLEHRLVMAEKLGRALAKTETVHHINGDSADNRLENLQLRQGKHGKHQCYRCADCGSRNIEAAPLE